MQHANMPRETKHVKKIRNVLLKTAWEMCKRAREAVASFSLIYLWSFILFQLISVNKFYNFLFINYYLYIISFPN
jgi:hypothetical protein